MVPGRGLLEAIPVKLVVPKNSIKQITIVDTGISFGVSQLVGGTGKFADATGQMTYESVPTVGLDYVTYLEGTIDY
jgi:hypothetical protein